MTDVLLQISGLSKDYHTLRPLRIKDLTVRHGDVVSMSGIDVPGAETLVHLVTGATLLDARPFADLIETVSLKHGVDPDLVHAVVRAESNYRPGAKSHVGARGLMQVMPTTALEFGIKNLYDPQSNLEAGVQYLKFLLARFDLKRAIAAYNAGPENVRKYDGIPPFPETQKYVKKVLENFQR